MLCEGPECLTESDIGLGVLQMKMLNTKSTKSWMERSGTEPITENLHVVKNFVPYPGYTGPLSVTGNAEVGSSASSPYHQLVTWHLRGADPACGPGQAPNVPNACGLHIHVGTDCSTNAGAHYHADGIPDPWGKVQYHVTGNSADRGGPMGPVEVMTGLPADQIDGHNVIVHDAAGKRVACGVLVAL